jgi:hypothetical protein
MTNRICHENGLKNQPPWVGKFGRLMRNCPASAHTRIEPSSVCTGQRSPAAITSGVASSSVM